MDGRLLFLVIALSACGSLLACKLPREPTQGEYMKYIVCLQKATGFTSDGGRWGRSVVNVLDRSQPLRKLLRSKKTECVLKKNPQPQDYVDYVMCLHSNGHTTDGGRWGRSVDEGLTRDGLKSKSKREECVLKSNPQPQDYVNYVMCLQGTGFTTDGGRWGRSTDREFTRNEPESKSKRDECVLKSKPQPQDYVDYVICLQGTGFTTDGGRWGRSIDREFTRNGLKSKSKRDQCVLKSNPQPQDYVNYVMCLQGSGFTSDGGRWGRSTDRARHYSIMEKVFRNVPDFGRWFQLRRESAHEQAEIPARQGGRDDDQETVFSRQANGRVQDLANAGVTIIEHPVKREIRLRDITAKKSS
ncbi:uncharacterized protein LOC135497919 [Lineus longissimus]|uniref:uncharacterized protein LOC135497919 n=1 Tax=Lineus longissimus TaxID=88925 RepID=UPI00315C6F4E